MSSRSSDAPGWRRIAVFGVLAAAAGGALGYAASLLLPDEYQSTARVLPPPIYSALPRMQIFSSEFSSERMIDQLTIRYQGELTQSVLRSAPILDAVVRQEDLVRKWEVSGPHAARERLVESTRISGGRDGLVTVLVTDREAPRAAAIANAYVTALEQHVADIATATARTRADAVSRQLRVAQDRLQELDTAFIEVQRRTGIARLNSDGTGGSANVNDLRQRLAMREAQLGAMSTYATATNPAQVRIRAEAEALRSQIALIVGGEGRLARASAADQSLYQRALREVRGAEDTVDGLRKQLAQAEFEAQSRVAGLQVVERAVPADAPSGPRRAFIAAVCALAALLGVLLWGLWRLRGPLAASRR